MNTENQVWILLNMDPIHLNESNQIGN